MFYNYSYFEAKFSLARPKIRYFFKIEKQYSSLFPSERCKIVGTPMIIDEL
jgi:hypothetical protein